MKNYFLLFAATLVFSSAFSQTRNHTVSGSILEKSSGLPLEYATVSFMKQGTNELVTGGISDLDGKFNISVPGGVYDIRFDYISYETLVLSNRTVDKDIILPPVSLDFDAESLDEVVIRAETTEVQVRLDKKIYNIGKDLTARGATVGDALSNVPSVNVNIEGGISLRGNDNVTILINGRPSAIAGFGDTDALTQLPADAIERVEVITSPSARYDAEGTAGILNIILKKDNLLGFNGSIAVNVGYPMTSGVTTNANLRMKKFNIFNTTGVFYRNQPGNARFENTFENSQFSNTIEERKNDRLRKGFNTNLGIEYFLSETSSITASGFLRLINRDDTTLTTVQKFTGNQLQETSLREEKETENDRLYQVALNYINNFNTDGHVLTADFQYSNNTEPQRGFISERNTFGPATAYPSEDIYIDEEQKNLLFQVDYVLPIGDNTQFEAGYRGNFRNSVKDYSLFRENLDTGEFEMDQLLTNVFDFTENVQALYTQFGTKFNNFSFLLGLRLENTQLKGKIDSDMTEEELQDLFGVYIDTDFDKNYLGLFPTVNLIYELNERENITLGYNRRINRPRGWFINPFPSRASLTNIFQGNPDLDPAYASAFDLGYLKRWDKVTLTSSVYFQHETQSFEVVRIRTGEVINGIDVVRSIPINLSTNQRIGAEAGVLYNPYRWWRMNGSFNFFQFNSKGSFEGVDFGAKNVSWFARFSSRVSLPAKIDWQTNMFYRGPSENAQTRTQGIFSLDLAFSKDIINDNATVSLNVSDLLNSRKRISNTVGSGFTSYSESQWRERQITFNFIYRFNEQKQRRDRDSRRRNNDNGGGGMDDFEGGF